MRRRREKVCIYDFALSSTDRKPAGRILLPAPRMQDTGQATSSSHETTWLPIGTVESLLTSHRHHVTLRSKTKPVTYHSILLFHFDNYASNQQQEQRQTGGVDTRAHRRAKRSWYAMVATCPHLGAPLESAAVRKVDANADAVP